MNLAKIKEILRADLIVASSLEIRIRMVCACDLMSDVLSYAKIQSGSLLLTNLAHTQAVRTAEMAEIAAVCFMRGKRPQSLAIDLARKNGIALLSSPISLYEASGLLYKKGLPGWDECGGVK